MKIIYEKEMTLIEYLMNMGIRFNADDFDNKNDYNDSLNFYTSMNDEKAKDVCILANAYHKVLTNFYDLDCIYSLYRNKYTKIFKCDKYSALKQLANASFMENREKLDEENSFWDYFNFDAFEKSSKEFYDIKECDFNNEHYVVIEGFE